MTKTACQSDAGFRRYKLLKSVMVLSCRVLRHSGDSPRGSYAPASLYKRTKQIPHPSSVIPRHILYHSGHIRSHQVTSCYFDTADIIAFVLRLNIAFLLILASDGKRFHAATARCGKDILVACRRHFDAFSRDSSAVARVCRRDTWARVSISDRSRWDPSLFHNM